jgi:hypothetical protein
MSFYPICYRRHYLILDGIVAVRRQSVAWAAAQGPTGYRQKFLHGGLSHPTHHHFCLAERALTPVVSVVDN